MTLSEALATPVYIMSIEDWPGHSYMYGFHLGTNEVMARQIIVERFHGRRKWGLPTITIALMLNSKIVDVYDGKWFNE